MANAWLPNENKQENTKSLINTWNEQRFLKVITNFFGRLSHSQS